MRGATITGEDEEIAKQMAERLKQAAQVAKDNTNAKAPKPDPPSSLVGVGSAAEGSSERTVAGRKKYSTGEAQEPVKEETQEDHDVEVELNSILKKSPSKDSFPRHHELSGTDLIIVSNSYNILKILLPTFAARKRYPPRQIHHRSSSIRRRARSTSPWRRFTGSISRTHRTQNSSECTHKRPQYWWRR